MTHSEYKEKAREHQIRFKEEELQIPSDRSPKRTLKWRSMDGELHQKEITVNSSLLYKDAKDKDGYVIFFPGYRKEITNAVNQSDIPTKGQMVTNLLRSEHIPYNVFFPMKKDLDNAAVLFNNVLGCRRISRINDIIVEHNPKRADGIHTFLNDGTSFDVFVDYTSIYGQHGGIGIEVKYTEKEYPIKKGTKEWSETHENDQIHLADNYRKPSFESGWFKGEFIADMPMSDSNSKQHVVANKYRQIWRNHILGADMLLNGELDEFTSLTVYPEGNVHFQDVLPEYEKLLTDKGKATFKHITYEKLFSLMGESFSQQNIPNVQDWIAYLRRRYIVA